MTQPDSEISEFQALYSEHHGWLQVWLRRRLGNSSEAADIAQDTFVNVLASDKARDIREPRSFLATVARNLISHRLRRKRLEEAYLETLANLPEAQAPSPEVRWLALEALQEIDQALDGLPARVRQAFLLAHLEGLNYAQIARRIGVSSSSVKQYLTRANRHCLFSLK